MLGRAGDAVLRLAAKERSLDNISVVIVGLPGLEKTIK